MVEQMMFLQIMQGQACEAALFGFVHRGCGTFGLLATGRTYFDKDKAATIQGDEVDLAMRASVVADQDAVTEASQKTCSGALGACTEPAPPPRFHDLLPSRLRPEHGREQPFLLLALQPFWLTTPVVLQIL